MIKFLLSFFLVLGMLVVLAPMLLAGVYYGCLFLLQFFMTLVLTAGMT